MCRARSAGSPGGRVASRLKVRRPFSKHVWRRSRSPLSVTRSTGPDPAPEERKQPCADDGKRVDSRHLVPAKCVEPGREPLGTDDGGEPDPVVAPPIQHPSLPPGRDEGRVGKQSGAPCLEDRPPRGAVHVRGRLVPEVLLDEIDENVNRPWGGTLDVPPELGVSGLVRGEVRDRADGPGCSPEQAGPARPHHQHPAFGAPTGKCRRPSHRSDPSPTPPPTAAARPAPGCTPDRRAPAAAPPHPARRARRSS